MDDASGATFDDMFERATAMDARIRLIRQPVNGGTYLARNAALQQARGSFITVQDADDWSHPDRLTDQLRMFEDDPDIGASRSDAIRAMEDLTHQWIGYVPRRRNASSLMFRRSAADRIGPFDAVRKGADSEYHERLKRLVGPVVDTHTPLAITRLRAGSLSRADFTYQWTSPDRLLYQAAYRAWHRSLPRESSPHGAVGDPQHRPFPVPPAFLRGITDVARQDVDLLLVLDPSRAAPAEAAVALARRARHRHVGVMILEDATRRRRDQPSPRSSFMSAVNDGVMTMVSSSEPVRARTTLVLSPGILVLPPGTLPQVTTDHLLAVAPLPSVASGVIDFVSANDGARAWFGTGPTWCAADPGTRAEWATDGWELPLLATELGDLEVTGDGPLLPVEGAEEEQAGLAGVGEVDEA